LYEITTKPLENYGIENLPKDTRTMMVFREDIKHVQVEKNYNQKTIVKYFKIN